jgi:hypothetical protein
MNIAQRVPGHCSDLRDGASDQREPGDGSASQIMKRQPGNTGNTTPARPRRPEAGTRPRLAIAVDQDDRRNLRHRIERSFERRTNRDHNASAGLALPQPNILPVIGRPRQAQEIALPLSSPQCEQQRQVQVRRCPF